MWHIQRRWHTTTGANCNSDSSNISVRISQELPEFSISDFGMIFNIGKPLRRAWCSPHSFLLTIDHFIDDPPI